MEQEGGPPLITGPEGGPVSYVHAVVASLKAMVSHLRCSSVTEAQIRDVEHHIKIFLSCFEEFDDAMREAKVWEPYMFWPCHTVLCAHMHAYICMHMCTCIHTHAYVCTSVTYLQNSATCTLLPEGD